MTSISMQDPGDPFDESQGELQLTLRQLVSLRAALQTSLSFDVAKAVGGVSVHGHPVDVEAELRRFASQLRRFQVALKEAEEDHTLLIEVVQALRDRRAGLRGQVYDPQLLRVREEFVAKAGEGLRAHREFLEGATARHEAQEAEYQRILHPASPPERKSTTKPRAVSPADEHTPAKRATLDESIASQKQIQEELRVEEERTLESLHRGLSGLRAKAITVNEEVGEQEKMLEVVEADINTLQGKLTIATRRVNHMLEQMSTKARTCIIILLCFVVGMLLAILITT